MHKMCVSFDLIAIFKIPHWLLQGVQRGSKWVYCQHKDKN